MMNGTERLRAKRMREKVDALRAEFEAMPFAARLAGAAYAERVFALLDAMIEAHETLQKGIGLTDD